MTKRSASLIVGILFVLALFAPGFAFADEGQGAAVFSTQASSAGSAQVASGLYTVSSSSKSSALFDVAAGSSANGATVQLYTDNSTPAQRWRIDKASDGLYKLVNVGSGKALTVKGNKAVAKAKIVQDAYRGDKGQQWKIVEVGGAFAFVSALSDLYSVETASGKTGNGAALQLAAASAEDAQTWKLTSVSAAVPDGVYTLKAACSGKVLDVASGSVNNRANVRQYASNGTVAQRFALRYDKNNGYYTVISVNSGLMLDVAGASVRNGGNVWLYWPNGTLAQKWAIKANGDGTFTLLSAKSGLALDVEGASKGNGANAQIYQSNGSAAQKWSLAEQANWLPDGVYSIVTTSNENTSLGVAKSSRSKGANVASAVRADTDWAQNWVVVQNGTSGYYTIRNLNSRLALDVAGDAKRSGANVQQDTFDKGAGQLWKPRITAGGIVWESKLDPSLVLDMDGNGKSAGTNVQVYASNNTTAQKFRLKQQTTSALLSGKTFTVRNVATGTVLDVRGASVANNAAIQLYASNGTLAQKFRFVSKGSDRYALVNSKSSKAVAASGARVVQNGNGSTNAQRWDVALDLATSTFAFASAQDGKRMDGTGGGLSLKGAVTGSVQQFVLQPTTADYFRVYLNSGHGWNSNNNGVYDPGAQAYGIREADLCSELSDLVIKYSRELYGLDIVDGRPYKLAYWDRLPKAIELKCSVIYSIHFDIDSGMASGPMGMVGVSGRHSASLTFNNIMMKHVMAALPALRERSTNYRNDITCVNGNIPACLVEVCFVDNPSDIAYYRSRKDAVAREIAAGLYEASQIPSLRKTA